MKQVVKLVSVLTPVFILGAFYTVIYFTEEKYEADSIEDAKKKVVKIAAEKMKDGERKVGQYIHEVDDDFEL